MRLAPTFITLLSFPFISAAIDQPRASVARVPLRRKSTINYPRDIDPVGYVDQSFLKSHVDSVAKKYNAAFVAYEANTGYPHPLAPPNSEIASDPSDPSAGKMKKRRQKRDATSDGIALGHLPGHHVPQSRHAKRDDVSLTDERGKMWTGEISVGNPPRTFIVDFDTGSADLILPDAACGSSCDGHTRYNSTASSTSVDMGAKFETSYQGGASVNGTQYTDTVYMGGYEAVNQTLGSALTYSTRMANSTFLADGLLGLGFPNISVFRASPVFMTMLSDNVLAEAVFGCALSSQDGESELTIGGTNTDLYDESTTEYINVSVQAFWQIPLAGVKRPGLGGAPDVVVVNSTSHAQALVDTGTTLIVTSDDNAQAFYANVSGARPRPDIGSGIWTVPCDLIDSLVPTFTFGSRDFVLSSSTFNQGQTSEGMCVGGIAGGLSASYWILGDVLLQNCYTIFDVGNARVGFADLASPVTLDTHDS